ncbi:GGDEF domain-containing protein [Kordiimonas aquimaris]|uniref:GGDEF domain-containing protein n=1 Tax=Kordiimonas aquimaris TaxID=707591 RepID=UPI0021D0D783|nr:GGDEF domain-containing protein [Kordiimonas aquimaris]
MKKAYFYTVCIALIASLIVVADTAIDIPEPLGDIALLIFVVAMLFHMILMLKNIYVDRAELKSDWTIDPNWLSDAIFVSDMNGNIHGVNNACTALIGNKTQCNGVQSLFEALHAQLNERDQADDIVTAVLSSPEIQFSDTLQLKDGRAIERSTKPIDGTDLRLWILSDVTQDLAVSDDHAMHQTMLEADAARTAEMAEQLYHAKAELEAKQAELTRLANTDSLTGLLNRRRFSAKAQETISTAKEDASIWALMLDIDHFKRVNDTYGHGAGDVAIRDFAHIMTEVVGDNGFVGRMGGEEFAAILPNCSLDDAFRLAEKIRKQTAKHQTVSEAEKFRFTTSIGIAKWQPNEINIETTLDRADQALYSAKSYGRNRVVGYE